MATGTAVRPRFVILGRGPVGAGGAGEGVRGALLSDMVWRVKGGCSVDEWERRVDDDAASFSRKFNIFSKLSESSTALASCLK